MLKRAKREGFPGKGSPGRRACRVSSARFGAFFYRIHVLLFAIDDFRVGLGVAELIVTPPCHGEVEIGQVARDRSRGRASARPRVFDQDRDGYLGRVDRSKRDEPRMVA